MHGHLVAVEVGVERLARQRVQLNSLAFHQHRLEGLNAQAVQRRCAVQQHRAGLDHVLKHFPHFGLLALDHALGTLDVGRIVQLDQLLDHKWLKQFQSHRLGQTALVQLECRANHDHRAARIVYALTQQVAPEAALLAFQHVTKRFEFAAATAAECLTALRVVDQRVDRLLQHALLVAHNHVRRAQFEQTLETVISVNDAAIQVI